MNDLITSAGLHLIHSRIGKKQCWIVMWNDRRGVNVDVLLSFQKVVNPNLSDIVCTQWRIHFAKQSCKTQQTPYSTEIHWDYWNVARFTELYGFCY